MRAVAPALLAAVALALPAQAAAQLPTPTPTPPPAPTPPPPAPTPTPAPPAAGTLRLSADRVLGGSVAVRGHAFAVRGEVRPYVPGQKVVVRVYRGTRKLRVRSLTVKPAGKAGRFQMKVGAARPGRLVVRAVHRATPQLATLRSRAVRVQVVVPHARPGARGLLVRLLQQKLAALHYAVPRSGVYDAGTSLAVLAWRKVAGMSRTTVANEAVFAGLLAGRGTFKVRHPQDGHHVETRLAKQVLAEIDHGRVVRVYHTSSGKASTPTVRGRFHVYRKQPGTNAHGMVDSSYFTRGYAIHGYASVPGFPASHGCLRVPIMFARAIYDWVRIGDVVWVEN